MSEADRIRLLHMLEAAEEAILIAETRSRTSLLAVMKDIEIIGEAANKVSISVRTRPPPFRGGILLECEIDLSTPISL